MKRLIALAFLFQAGPAAAQALEPDALPLLGDGPVVAESMRTFVWTKPYEFTYRPARWNLEGNDETGRVRMLWGDTSASLTISLDDEPVAKGAKTFQTMVGGLPAVETIDWADAGDGRPVTLYDVIRCKRKGNPVLLTLAVPEKHEGAAEAAILEMREIQRAWKWH